MGKMLDEIVANPNRPDPINNEGFGPMIRGTSRIRCADGFSVSVISGAFAYCAPRGDIGPYREVEMGFPTERPEPWDSYWAERAESPGNPTETVYGYVPVEAVQALIDLHGGEVES